MTYESQKNQVLWTSKTSSPGRAALLFDIGASPGSLLMFCPRPCVLTENWMILALLYYPALCYPLLACGTLHNKVGYVLGSLLSWTHFSVLVWQKIDCPATPQVRTGMYTGWTLLR